MNLNFEKGEWSLLVNDIDASIIDYNNGVHVALAIGEIFGGQNVPMWVDYIVYPPSP